MNERIERIRELRAIAKEAGFVLWKGAERRYRRGQLAIDWSSNYDDELEKFAELVIQDYLTKMIDYTK